MNVKKIFITTILWICAHTSIVYAGKWITYTNCTLEKSESNDGDSFHVRAPTGHIYIFRLYYVDAPEKDDDYPDRLKEQAAHFGITSSQVLSVGRLAARYATSQLGRGPFVVHTRKEDARGSSRKPRYYALITTCDGRDLAADLLRNGYARLFGMPTKLPDGTAEHIVRWRLKAAEQEARSRCVGGWAKTNK
jgi:endonuclease YncB( thermonuclease family)